MASVDPYSPCPCGSGQKFKWCCQKVETYAERAQRLVENGQYETALKPLEEGLSKVPDSAWLLTRKALIHLHLRQIDTAKHLLVALLQKQPKHLGASILMTRVTLESEGPAAAAARFQQALSAAGPSERKQLARLALFLGSSLNRAGYPAAGLKHLELSSQLGGDDNQQVATSIRMTRASPSISVWEKNPYRLWSPPENVSEQFRISFERATGWANQGLWAAAASAFELLAAGSYAGAIANRNRGLCCLWIADHTAAVESFRRYIARTGATIDAVDLEALCQLIEAPTPTDRVELLHLSWPVRKRDGLLGALHNDKTFEEGPQRPLNPDDPKSPQVLPFYMLDRPMCTARAGVTREEIPLIEAEVLVAQDSVVLEACDDGRLDRLIDRFTITAGSNIPPAHPRTKVIGHEQRHHLSLTRRWQLPKGLSEEDADRLRHEQFAYIVREIWPRTPHPSLRWRTPLEAAKAGDSETALRAAVLSLEQSHEDWSEQIDWTELRLTLRLNAEPAPDSAHLEFEQLHLARLSSIPIEPLDDERLLALYDMSRQWGLRSLMIRLANKIAERPSLFATERIETTALYAELALHAARQHDRAKAYDWLQRGRNADPPHKRAAHALSWELTELQIQMAFDGPELWVPTLAAMLERHRGDREATSALLVGLINLGLVQLVPDQYRPDHLAVDTRTLEAYLNQFGPRVTTAAGELGVSATRGEIWTPAAASSGGPIWTPGSTSPPASPTEKPKIIVTGH